MIRDVFTSGRPLTYIRSAEEERIGRVLREVALPMSSDVWTWSLTEGMHRDGQPAEVGTHDPRGALDFIAAHALPAIFHLKDFHEPLRESPEIRRRLRDVYEHCLDQGKFCVITAPIRFLPEEVQQSVMYLDLRPPDVVELVEFLRDEASRLAPENSGVADELLHQFARALLGLTLDESRYALRRALAANRLLTPESLPSLLEEKRLLVNRSGVIEFVSEPTRIEEIGGLDGLKNWLLERRKLFEMRDDLSAESSPKAFS